MFILSVLLACEEPTMKPGFEEIVGDDDGDGYTMDEGDCDPNDAQVNPGEIEAWYDGVDQNCDGNDLDQDLDGTEVGEDCDDADATAFPGGTEICDGIDNDCDDAVDEEVGTQTGYADADADGFGTGELETLCGDALPEGYAAVDGDCDDAVAAINPLAIEVCNDLDDDCDDAVDDGATDLRMFYADADLDGYGSGAASIACSAPEGAVENADDCNDGSNTVHPGADEHCDGGDENCDGAVDESPVDGLTFYADADTDGFGDASAAVVACDLAAGIVANADDCDDGLAAVNPDADEVCNGQDDNCDSVFDTDAIDVVTWYADADADGYGDADVVTATACDAPADSIGLTGDCDDADGLRNPGVSEADNDIDDDCDTMIDEDFVAEGDLVITEVARQPWVGGTSTDNSAMWFEVYNASAGDIDLAGFTIRRSNTIVGSDAFAVDPDDGVSIGAGEYAVFCKTDDWVAPSDANSSLECDYIWGDEAEAATFSGAFHDNTFNLQRDEDTLSIETGGAVDSVNWLYGPSDFWPREAMHSLSVNAGFEDAADNDDLLNWCAAPTSIWYDAADDEYGTPGGVNDPCP